MDGWAKKKINSFIGDEWDGMSERWSDSAPGEVISGKGNSSRRPEVRQMRDWRMKSGQKPGRDKQKLGRKIVHGLIRSEGGREVRQKPIGGREPSHVSKAS